MWAKHALKKNKYLKRTQSLQADIDSIVSEIGDVVGIQSDITSWGTGGRIMGATTTSVVIDQAVTLAPGTTYSLLVRFPDNTLVRRVVDAVAVSTTTTTLAFTSNPWATAPERFCIYSFGVNTLETKPFQITGIRRNGELQATLELLEYVAEVYTEATDFPVIDYTAANAGINSLTVKADSDTGKLGIAWTIPTDRDYIGSVVYVDGKPQGWFPTDVTDIDIDVPPGTHTVTVRPVDGSGNYGTATEEEVTLGSPTLSSVSAVSLSSTVKGQADGTNLVYITGAFTIPALASSVLVEIGEGSNPAAWATVQDSRVAAVQYGPVLPGTLYTLRFTAKNRYAAADPVLEPVTTAGDTTAPDAPTVSASGYLKVIKVDVELTDPPSDLAGFEIWKNTENNANTAGLAGYVAAVSGAAFFIDQAPSYLSEMYYWAKSVDTWGNKSGFSASSLPTHVSQILSGDITANEIVGKHFTTALDVGVDVDGVRFTAAGIEMWQAGIKKVSIPVSGSPDFKGTITAMAGFIGECVIADGGLRSVDFISNNRGWRVTKTGEAEFNNLRARGAIETVVFKKDQISITGGRHLVRPGSVVDDYDYDAYLAEIVANRFSAYWQQLDSLLDAVEAPPAFSCADYEDFYDTELGYWLQISGILETGVFSTAIASGDFTCPAQQTQFAAYWATLNSLLDQSVTTPTFACTNFAGYESVEFGGWMQLNEFLDLDIFEPSIGADDIRLY
ncbi:MAG TPA: hypothetical protein PLR50_03465, partial [Candidatus Rifleibacterium sp.]|nr:hypothetical protein [Candidatus Rifleibacterium sp.]